MNKRSKTDGTNREADGGRMSTAAALAVLVDLRGDQQIVVTHQSSALEWPKLCDHPLDFHYLPSTMGGAIPLGLGLALAQPERHVVVISGEGALLMNLGSLVTVAGSGAANLSIVVLDNGVYAMTGGQTTPAAGAEVDWAGLARAAGFPNVSHFWELADWRRRAPEVFSRGGPRFLWLQVAAEHPEAPPGAPEPIDQRAARLRKALIG